MPSKAVTLWRLLDHKAAPGSSGRPQQRDFDALREKFRQKFFKWNGDLATRMIDENQWLDGISDLLKKSHTQAWVLGRQRAGDGSPQGDDDLIAGIAAKDEEDEFLQGFLDDILGGRYSNEDGSLRLGAINARAQLYAGKLRGTANEAFVEAGDDEEEYEWVLVAEDHCEDCPRIAAESPFQKDANYGWPGSGETECLGNCKCYIRRVSDGLEGFKNED